MKTVLFTGTHGDEFVTISGKFAQHTDPLVGNETAGNHPHSEQVANPLGVLGIVLIALHGGYPFGVGNNHMDSILKDIPNRYPVFASTFHADILAVIVKEPLLQGEQITTECGKPFLMVLWNKPVRFDDGGDKKGFVEHRRHSKSDK